MSKPDSLAALFKGKAKKKPKSTNLNADPDRPTPAAEPKLRKAAPPEDLEPGWERALRHDQELLKDCDLWIKDIESDGACLFRAIADQMEGGAGDNHDAYRERCVDYIKNHRNDFEPFMEDDFESYCKRMREITTWGGHLEAQALAKSLGVNILIYRPSDTVAGRPEGLMASTIDIIASEEADCRCVQLSFHPKHHHGQHYNSVRCKEDSGEEAALHISVAEIRRRVNEAIQALPARKPKPTEEMLSGLKPLGKVAF